MNKTVVENSFLNFKALVKVPLFNPAIPPSMYLKGMKWICWDGIVITYYLHFHLKKQEMEIT